MAGEAWQAWWAGATWGFGRAPNFFPEKFFSWPIFKIPPAQ